MQLWRCLTNLAPVPLSRDVVKFKIRNQKGMTWLYFQKTTNLSNYCLGSAAFYLGVAQIE